MKTYIHVNRQSIQKNNKYGTREPVCVARNSKKRQYSRQIDIIDDNGKVIASLVQADDKLGIKPLSCRAKSFIVADSKNVRVKKR